MSHPDGRMILATFIHNAGGHPAGWRYEPTGAIDQHDFQHYARMARSAERAKLHIYFSGDSQGYPHLKGRDAFMSSDWAGKLEPTTLLAALAAVTTDIGLIATASTTYNEPYALARRFASLDHISGGRVGWNVVTSGSDNEAHNFGLPTQIEHDERYRRAAEFVEVAKCLWDSWEDGAHLRDQASGRYFDPDRVHALYHRGPHFSVEGPLNVGRPPQGHPVIVQAGDSEAGRQLGARTADLIFTPPQSLVDAQRFYAEMKRRAADCGRDPRHLLIIPSVRFLVRSTEREAQRVNDELRALIPDPVTVARLEMRLGVDLPARSLDEPLPDLPVSTADPALQQLVATARAEGWTVRQLARRAFVSRGAFQFAGTPEAIAELCATWLRESAADGFSLSPDYHPSGLEEFLSEVVPVLQRSGLFRSEYEGRTLRENLGLPRPSNRFVESPALGGEPNIWA